MSRVRAVRVPPTLVRGRIRRLVVAADGAEHVEVWSGEAWHSETHGTIEAVEVQRGVVPPPAILRALGVPEEDWPRPAAPRVLPVLAMLGAAEQIQTPLTLLLAV